MKRGESGEDVRVARVQAVENAEAGHFVEAAETGHVAWSAGHGLEAVEGDVPRGGGGVYVVECESEEVDQQEYHREVEVLPGLAGEIQPEAEEYRQRHPAEIEYSGCEIGRRTVVYGKKLVGREPSGGSGDSEERFFGFVEALYVDRIDHVVGHDVHPVV